MLLGATASVACRKKNTPSVHAAVSDAGTTAPPPTLDAPPPRDPRSEIDIVDWSFPADGGFEKRVVVIVPKALPAGTKLPLLVTLHGMGETVDARTGAYGWLESYTLDVTLSNLRHPPLDVAAFQGFVTPERLAQINADLATQPFGGMVIACPYLPRDIGSESTPFDAYTRFLGDKLLPRLRNEAPVLADARNTGIDGVSLGGMNALRFGLMRPDLFGVIGALQPAVYDDVGTADYIAQKLAKRPLRIVTSSEDVYKDTLTTMSMALTDRSVAHQFAVTPGPHDYAWNKGAGGIEMALWHDRVQRM